MSTAVIVQAHKGQVPEYLAKLEQAPMRHMFDLYVRYGQEVKQHP